MKSEQFAYWLQGFAELTPGQTPSKEQWEMIVEHLAEVFDKVTPPMKTPGYAHDPKYGLFGGAGINTGAVCRSGVSTLALNSNLLSESVSRASALADTALTTHIGSLQSQVTGDTSLATSMAC
jgi:hypothetical protein